jgi:hypothetical protein
VVGFHGTTTICTTMHKTLDGPVVQGRYSTHVDRTGKLVDRGTWVSTYGALQTQPVAIPPSATWTQHLRNWLLPGSSSIEVPSAEVPSAAGTVITKVTTT